MECSKWHVGKLAHVLYGPSTPEYLVFHNPLHSPYPMNPKHQTIQCLVHIRDSGPHVSNLDYPTASAKTPNPMLRTPVTLQVSRRNSIAGFEEVRVPGVGDTSVLVLHKKCSRSKQGAVV